MKHYKSVDFSLLQWFNAHRRCPVLSDPIYRVGQGTLFDSYWAWAFNPAARYFVIC